MACIGSGNLKYWERVLETSLYLPVKRFLESLGFVVKGEVGGCDLLALGRDFALDL